MKNSRPLIGNSVEVNTLTEFKKLVKKNKFTFDSEHYKAYGYAGTGWAYDQHGDVVGYLYNYHGSSAGFVSPNGESFKLDFIDVIVRQQEEILVRSTTDWDYSEDIKYYNSKEEAEASHLKHLARKKADCIKDAKGLNVTIKLRKKLLKDL